MQRPWLSAIVGTCIGVLALAALLFLTGVTMALIDSVGVENKDTHILSAGIGIASMGLIVYGLPVALLSGALAWRASRKPRGLTNRCS